MLLVCLLEFFIGQGRDEVGISARIMAIDLILPERTVKRHSRKLIGGGVCTLHLVIYHTVDAEIALFVKLVVPALLMENRRICEKIRSKHRIKVNVGQVKKILFASR